MFFKFWFSFVSVIYCFVSQDFLGSNLNLFINNFGIFKDYDFFENGVDSFESLDFFFQFWNSQLFLLDV